jgi:hypothetical protein
MLAFARVESLFEVLCSGFFGDYSLMLLHRIALTAQRGALQVRRKARPDYYAVLRVSHIATEGGKSVCLYVLSVWLARSAAQGFDFTLAGAHTRATAGVLQRSKWHIRQGRWSAILIRFEPRGKSLCWAGTIYDPII